MLQSSFEYWSVEKYTFHSSLLLFFAVYLKCVSKICLRLDYYVGQYSFVFFLFSLRIFKKISGIFPNTLPIIVKINSIINQYKVSLTVGFKPINQGRKTIKLTLNTTAKDSFNPLSNGFLQFIYQKDFTEPYDVASVVYRLSIYDQLIQTFSMTFNQY